MYLVLRKLAWESVKMSLYETQKVLFVKIAIFLSLNYRRLALSTKLKIAQKTIFLAHSKIFHYLCSENKNTQYGNT